MYHYEYVTRKEAEPYRNEFLDIIHEAQDLLRDKFTFRYDFIGSSSRNMITFDAKTNKGFDFDVNLEVNDDENNYDAATIKKLIMRAINQVARTRGFSDCEDSTRVFTLKKKNHFMSSVEYSCDFAIVNNYLDAKGCKRQQYIHFQKNQNRYMWNKQPKGFNLEDKVDWIKQHEDNLWDEVLDVYLDKKNSNENPDKKSRALYAETINEVCQRYGYPCK